MAKGFNGVNVSFVGTHEHSDKMPRWLKANGGIYSRNIDESVTHLIATESAVKANVDAASGKVDSLRTTVEKARSLKIKIVTYDWLEDSLLSKTCKPKREGPYLWDRILRESKPKGVKKPENKEARQKKLKRLDSGNYPTRERERERNGNGTEFNITLFAEKLLGELSQGARAIVSDMERLGYHLYVDDSTGVSYSATLVRNTLVNDRSRKETFHTGVYESNDMPHNYTTFVKYTRAGASSKDMLAPKGSLDSALFAFKKFFHMKTGLEWKGRFDDSKVPVSCGKEGDIGSSDQGWFRYERPAGLMAALNIDAERTLCGEQIETGSVNEEGEAEDDAALASVDDNI
ncbi:hypothetical protein UA08_00838 [Talaromyces atroroseus]|uniref:Uncharacterized protein n=1 Tax=Talaromyces atroroseus TaxID=1441469 RepID=A0A225ASJ0_TALAT|nr:hypothetical protein UA08_00838 [Talaromyces atroroseus]OKL64552.1 hypothetical protein UA08_00838 [Talaromyces atroroseus]